MTIKNILLSISLISSLGVFSINALASDKALKTVDTNDSQQMSQKEIAKKFSRGESFTQGGIAYTVYPDLKADFNKNKKETLSGSNSKSASVLSTKSFTIYNTAPSNKKENLNSSGKQVVLNDSTENFGILSGVIIVKTKDNSTFKDPSFELVKSYPKLGFYLIRIPNNLKIQDTINKIKNNKSVEETTVEVLENFKEPL